MPKVGLAVLDEQKHVSKPVIKTVSPGRCQCTRIRNPETGLNVYKTGRAGMKET